MFSVRPRASQAAAARGVGSGVRAMTRGPWWDAPRRWRTLDVGTTKAYLQAAAPRVACVEHGVVVAHVPWARPGAKHTWAFEDTCAWLAAHTALSVLTVLLRHRVAHRGRDRGPSGRRWPRHQRSASMADPDRHR